MQLPLLYLIILANYLIGEVKILHNYIKKRLN